MAWIGPTIGAVGSLLGGVMGSSGQRDANRKNLQIAREQMKFQREMSNTAYQRGVKDLEAAGLNPMLAIRGADAASTPQGASATMENENAELGRGVASAAQVVNQKLQNELLVKQIELTGSSAREKEAQTSLLQETKEKVNHEIANVMEQLNLLQKEGKQRDFELNEMNPLVKAYQEFVNKQMALSIPPLEADAKFWAMAEEEGKAMSFIMEAVRNAAGIWRGFRGNPTTINNTYRR